MALTPEDVEQLLDFAAAVLGSGAGEPTVADLLAWVANGRAVAASADYLAAMQAADFEGTPQTATALARVVRELSGSPE